MSAPRGRCSQPVTAYRQITAYSLYVRAITIGFSPRVEDPRRSSRQHFTLARLSAPPRQTVEITKHEHSREPVSRRSRRPLSDRDSQAAIPASPGSSIPHEQRHGLETAENGNEAGRGGVAGLDGGLGPEWRPPAGPRYWKVPCR